MTQPQGHTEETPAQPEPLLVRVEEAARLLSLSRSMVYQLMDSGVLPSIRCGSARRIPTAALHAWIAQQLTPSRQEH